MREEWVTVAVAAKKTGVTARSVYRWVNDGLNARAIDGKLLVNIKNVRAFKQYKSLENPVANYRRRKADIQITESQAEGIKKAFAEAGGTL